MLENRIKKRQIAFFIFATTLFNILTAFGQTKITLPKNDFPVSEDIKRGRETAAEAETDLTIIKDVELTRYVQSLGDKLVAAVAPEFRHPEFSYTFKIVDDGQINAFALPGGYIFVNRGLLEKTGSEAELAGVIAHEISHVVLRHGMAKQTRFRDTQPGAINQITSDPIVCQMLGNLCSILATSQATSARSFLNVYERADEIDADVLGVQTLFNAGYNPREMAAMLRLLKQQGADNLPPWVKSHPDVDVRVARVEREVGMFGFVAPKPVNNTKFDFFKARLQKLYPANKPVVSQTEKSTPPANSKSSIPLPSPRFKEISGDALRLNVPENWQVFGKENLFIAPGAAYHAEHGITHGIMLGVHREANADAETTLKNFISGMLSANSYLDLKGSPASATLSGNVAMQVTLAGKSPVTNQNEIVTLYILPLAEDTLFYLATVVPQTEQTAYEPTFKKIFGSLKLGSN